MEENGDFGELELNHFQKDALSELGNIASAHAVTSLAEMTGMIIDMEVPSVDVVPLTDMKHQIETERIGAGILIGLEGSFSGHMQILFPKQSALTLTDLLMGRMPGETMNIVSEMEESALKEIGNILASSFCDAIADFLQFSLLPSPPSFTFDLIDVVVGNAVAAVVAGSQKDERTILFKCDFKDENENGLRGYIMLFPQKESLKNILAMLEAKVTYRG
ncbi:MAG: chemotaxis protein CheC [Methanomicrobia archaeon]|nr:chemotaxis protein CheC [Methanomicrobia archaeon]